jgi:hypothetical protein
MRSRVARSLAQRFVRIALLAPFLLLIGTMIGLRVQSLLFEKKVHSVLSRLEQFQLEKTPEEAVLRSLPQLKSGILWSFLVNGRSNDSCPGDACYVLYIQNVPNGILFRLREKLNYQHDWIFKAAYLMGHRFWTFAAYVEIRGKRASRYEYALSVEDAKSPANGLVGVQVLGANRASFPAGYGFIEGYDEIRGFKVTRPSNRQTTDMRVAFTPEAEPGDVRNAFDLHLDCVWNFEGCSATSQLLPSVWERATNGAKQN